MLTRPARLLILAVLFLAPTAGVILSAFKTADISGVVSTRTRRSMRSGREHVLAWSCAPTPAGSSRTIAAKGSPTQHGAATERARSIPVSPTSPTFSAGRWYRPFASVRAWLAEPGKETLAAIAGSPSCHTICPSIPTVGVEETRTKSAAPPGPSWPTRFVFVRATSMPPSSEPASVVGGEVSRPVARTVPKATASARLAATSHRLRLLAAFCPPELTCTPIKGFESTCLAYLRRRCSSEHRPRPTLVRPRLARS